MKEHLLLENTIHGKYIVAVSGGVDSVVLLDLLAKKNNLDLIVAHADHGIRPDSKNDSTYVEQLAANYNLPFKQISLDLGPDASEDLARQKRYQFLNSLKQNSNAKAVITAHHQDDLIETCFINMVRGTGSRGLASLGSSSELIRPLLGVSKQQIIDYAQSQNLKWHEDSTNSDTTYLRNRIRLQILPKMTNDQRNKILNIIANAKIINTRLDKELNSFLYRGMHKGQPVISRAWFNYLPHNVATEVIRKLLVNNGATNIDKKTIDRVTVNLKVLPAGRVIQAPGVNITLTKRSARLKNSGKTDKKRI